MLGGGEEDGSGTERQEMGHYHIEVKGRNWEQGFGQRDEVEI